MDRDKFIAKELIKLYPPTNVVVLTNWSHQTKDIKIKNALEQWIQTLKGERAFIDGDIFDYLIKKCQLPTHKTSR